MSSPVRLAVDAMGGDFGPRVTVPAVLSSLTLDPHLSVLLVGDKAQIDSFIPSGFPADVLLRLDILHTEESISNTDKPSQVLRHKQQSSMWLAIDRLKQGDVQACVSAGNTGALMALGRFILKTFPGVDRPAICKPVPTRVQGSRGDIGRCYMLDLGANINCDSEQLLQFALMGSVLVQEIESIAEPRVGLLNIGEENIKGGEQLQLAAALLTDNPHLNYVGYIEGNGIYTGSADVLVCDGFAGNIALKASEGAATFMAKQMAHIFKSSRFGRIIGWFARPLLLEWRNQFNPDRYNGASFLGLQGTLVKSHGNADVEGFISALSMAKEQAQKHLPEQINQRFAELTQ